MVRVDTYPSHDLINMWVNQMSKAIMIHVEAYRSTTAWYVKVRSHFTFNLNMLTWATEAFCSNIL